MSHVVLLQLVFESRVTLEEAIGVYSFYNDMFEPASKYIGSKEVFAFESSLQNVLKVSLIRREGEGGIQATYDLGRGGGDTGFIKDSD